MDKHLGIALRDKPVTGELFFELEEIIHFPVLGNPDIPVLVRQGLPSPFREIDDGEPGMSQGDLFISIGTSRIRTAMIQGIHHIPDKQVILKTEKATNPTHDITCCPLPDVSEPSYKTVPGKNQVLVEVEYIFMSRVSLLKRAFFTDAGSSRRITAGGCFVSDGWQRMLKTGLVSSQKRSGNTIPR